MATALASDFVNVQLSSAGQKIAGAKGTLRVTTQHFSYEFTAGAPTRVLSSEWRRTLSREMIQGEKVLELAAAPVAQPVAAQPTTKSAPSPTAQQAPAVVDSAPVGDTNAKGSK
jgi:hypothetical protein